MIAVDGVLNAAGDYMEHVGKCEGAYTTNDGRVCAVGAVVAVLRTGVGSHILYQDLHGSEGTALQKLSRWLQSENDRGDIIEWSDTHTQDEVVKGFRSAAVWIES